MLRAINKQPGLGKAKLNDQGQNHNKIKPLSNVSLSKLRARLHNELKVVLCACKENRCVELVFWGEDLKFRIAYAV